MAESKTNWKYIDDWSKKNGFAIKSFNIRKDITDAFVDACRENKESQRDIITKLMLQYIEETEQKRSNEALQESKSAVQGR